MDRTDALRFVLGRAGSGKTCLCLDEVRQELRRSPWGPPLFLLVPEQATFQMEYELARTPGLPGSVRARVVSFRRLAYQVLQQNRSMARPPLGELGRGLVLRLLLRRRSADLRLFRASAQGSGFPDELARLIQELSAYGHVPADLERLAAGPSLSAKLQDLALIWSDYKSFLDGRYSDPDTLLDAAAGVLPSTGIMDKAQVWVDGFAGFTPQEYRMLAAIMACSAKVAIALCLDPGQPELFRPTLDTYTRLRRLAGRIPLDYTEIRLPARHDAPSRFFTSPSLAFLEREFARPDPAVFPGDPPGITLAVAPDPWAETQAAAGILKDWAASGLRWREMAVIVRDLQPYREIIRLVFDSRDIPFFLDSRRPMVFHPLSRLLLAAVEVVASNWAVEPLFLCLKTDLWPISRAEADSLENYSLAYGIRGSTWKRGEPWNFHSNSQGRNNGFENITGRVDQLRRQVVELFGPLGRVAPGRPLTGREWTECLSSLLDNLDAANTLERWGQEAARAGDPGQAQEHGQVWQSVLRLNREIAEVLGEEPLTVREFGEVLRAGLEGLSLGLIPPGIDQVLVGSIERSRQPELKAALILGVNDGVFPARFAERGLLSDSEREILGAYGLELAPSTRERLFMEDFLAYIAFTRPSERLWVSYCAADTEGRALSPSRLVSHLLRLFPGLSLTRLPPAGALAEDSRPVPRGDDPLPEELVDRIYPSPVWCSISRLQTLAQCPFAHFASHGLRLRERQVLRLDPPGMGIMLHEALKRVADRLAVQGRRWKDLAPGEGEALAREEIEGLAAEERQLLLFDSARSRYLKNVLARIAGRAVGLLVDHARLGEFKPVAVEADFAPGGGLEPISLELRDGRQVLITGRIDRIEAARGPDGWYIRVIDFKSGPASFNTAKAEAGLEMQLALYLCVALDNAARLIPGGGQALSVVPAGLFYFPVQDPIVSARGPLGAEEARGVLRGRLRLQGALLREDQAVSLMVRDRDQAPGLIPVSFKKDGSLSAGRSVLTRAEMENHLARVRSRAERLIEAMLRGQTEAVPARWGRELPCDRCSYAAVCQQESVGAVSAASEVSAGGLGGQVMDEVMSEPGGM